MNNTPKGMKPFNLERALAGDEVVTRDGDFSEVIGFQKSIDDEFCLVVAIEGEFDFVTKNGMFSEKRWLGINVKSGQCTSMHYTSEEKCRECAHGVYGNPDWQIIEIEVEV